MPQGLHQEPVPALADRYRVIRSLGSGGKAVVWLADDRLLKRQVAIKAFTARAETAEALREQEAEAKLIASLNHHALTTLFDAGVDTSDPRRPQVYLVMEYIPGSDLKRRLERGALPWFQVCWLGRDLSEGLGYLHEHGFLHRDIKPANVLLASRDAEVRPRAKLADFGISSLIGSRDGGDEVTGTAAYLSPEQVLGEPPAPASDVYSLGLVLLEALSARTAFPGDVEESAFARLDRDPVIPTGLPPKIHDVLHAMTALDPAQRPSLVDAAAVFQNLLIDDLVRQRGYAALPPDPAAAARVSAADRYAVLDTPPEEAFDRIVRLAARVLRAPLGALSVIDGDRVWVKSAHGTDQQQLARQDTFCGTTAPAAGPWTIPDALADPRTRHLPSVTGAPGVRSYAAAPLVTRDGHALGALCVCDTVPREFDAEALAVLAGFAEIVLQQVELRLASRRALFDR